MIRFATKKDFEEFAKNMAVKSPDNPRYCLSPLRYLGKCYQCPVLQTLSGKTCESSLIVEEDLVEQENLFQEKKDLVMRLKAIDERISNKKFERNRR